jgi:hypothetical protein
MPPLNSDTTISQSACGGEKTYLPCP